MNEFKRRYDKARTWGELDAAVEKLNASSQRKMADSMELVKNTTGLDMRQAFLLGILKGKIK